MNIHLPSALNYPSFSRAPCPHIHTIDDTNTIDDEDPDPGLPVRKIALVVTSFWRKSIFPSLSNTCLSMPFLIDLQFFI